VDWDDSQVRGEDGYCC